MKTLVVYYSYTGACERQAKKLAEERGADCVRVLDEKRPGTLAAYTAGCYRALRQQPAAVQPLQVDMNDYDALLLVAPVWASHPAPPFNSVVQQLPAGKEVELYLVSASGGGTKREKIVPPIEKKGSHVTQYYDVKSSSI